MLYHFPYESPEELLQKEGEYLERQIESAKRVEKHGYRKKEMSLSSFYIEWLCFHRYLRCPIETWEWPSSSREKVALEPIPSEFLPSLSTILSRPLKFKDVESGEIVRRIVGFREIQKKREYVEYLREVEGWREESDDGGDGKDGVKIMMESEEEESQEEEPVEEEDPKGEESMDDELFYKSQPYLRLARGGGKKKEKDKDAKKGEAAHDKKKDKPKKHEKEKKGKKDKADKDKEEDKGPGIIQKIINYFKGEDDDSKDKAKKKAEKTKKEKEKEKEKEKKKKEEKAKKAKGDTSPRYHKWALSRLWKDLERQKDQMELQHQKNLEQIFKYHGLFRVHATKERDSEWLDLSNTDQEETEKEIKTFEKPRDAWMMEAISFESQFLAKSLKLYTIFTNITGRSFMRIKPDTDKGHMDFTHKKRNVILFFISSIFFWCCFCLITISFLSIQGENQAQGLQKEKETAKAGSPAPAVAPSSQPSGSPSPSKDPEITLEDLQVQVTQARHEVEELMLYLYEVPLFVLIINLVLVAVWSILVILGDGIFIAHYFNCWCAALAEMETSGCLGIKNTIIVHHIGFGIYALIISLLFVFDYPRHVRQSNLLIAALIMRPLKPYLRIDVEENLLPYMIGGMIFQLYVIYCAMIIKLLMAILATILKNASEMWNFKFALTFQQLATKNRGQLLRMGLNHSLLKLFTHHRILTVLLRNFGEVFSIPIMLHMIMEMGVLTIALVRWFFYNEESVLNFYENEVKAHTVVIRTFQTVGNPVQNVTEKIVIPYYHSKTEVHLILYLMMIQLLYQFMRTQDILATAGNAFFAGYEFVRRSGTILCRNSHQRRLIQSLEWSFSSTNPSVLSANSYYTINRATILSSFAAVAGFFSLIIQLQVEPSYSRINFTDYESCQKFGLELYRGGCVAKSRESSDPSLEFKFPPQAGQG